MKGKKIEKRTQRAYKIKPSIYEKARKRANKNGVPLATTVENWITLYAEGYSIGILGTTGAPYGNNTK